MRPAFETDPGQFGEAIIRSAPELNKFVSFAPRYVESDREHRDGGRRAAEEYFAMLRDQFARKEKVSFVVERRGVFLGVFSVHTINEVTRSGEFSCWVDSRHAGRGVTSAANRCWIDWAFETVGFIRISAFTALDNIASRKMTERAGFRLVGVSRKRLLVGSEFRDAHEWEMTGDEWRVWRDSRGPLHGASQ